MAQAQHERTRWSLERKLKAVSVSSGKSERKLKVTGACARIGRVSSEGFPQSQRESSRASTHVLRGDGEVHVNTQESLQRTELKRLSTYRMWPW